MAGDIERSCSGCAPWHFLSCLGLHSGNDEGERDGEDMMWGMIKQDEMVKVREKEGET